MIPWVNGTANEAFELRILTSKPAFIPPRPQVPTDNCSKSAYSLESAAASSLRPHRDKSQSLTFTHHCGRNTPPLHPRATQPSLGCTHLRSRSPQRSANTDPSPSRQSGSPPAVAQNSVVYAAQPSLRRLAKPTPVLSRSLTFIQPRLRSPARRARPPAPHGLPPRRALANLQQRPPSSGRGPRDAQAGQYLRSTAQTEGVESRAWECRFAFPLTW